MDITVGAETIGSVELAPFVAIKRESLLAMVEANHIGALKIGRGTSFDPASCVRLP